MKRITLFNRMTLLAGAAVLVLPLAAGMARAAEQANAQKPAAAKTEAKAETGSTNGNANTHQQEAEVQKLIQARLGDESKVDAVTKTPYGGLFEVRIGTDIIYTDAKAEFLFVGRVLDTRNFRDITRERVDELTKVKFSDLPLELAIKTVKGDGKRVIAVFEDPNCGYCKRFRKTLQDVDNITVYTFMYNILSPDSGVKSKNIWCSANRGKAWDDWMLNGKAAPAAPESCPTPNDKVLALGQKLKITGTPTIFFADGTRVPGAVDLKALQAKLASLP